MTNCVSISLCNKKQMSSNVLFFTRGNLAIITPVSNNKPFDWLYVTEFSGAKLLKKQKKILRLTLTDTFYSPALAHPLPTNSNTKLPL